MLQHIVKLGAMLAIVHVRLFAGKSNLNRKKS